MPDETIRPAHACSPDSDYSAELAACSWWLEGFWCCCHEAETQLQRSTASAEAVVWTQVAVLRETDAKGPFCSLIMSVVVVKDVLLFMCFAINVEFARVVRLGCVLCGAVTAVGLLVCQLRGHLLSGLLCSTHGCFMAVAGRVALQSSAQNRLLSHCSNRVAEGTHDNA